jgi:L-alanine-DL-glutamate epimerase-like enolase superfamily enzyme
MTERTCTLHVAIESFPFIEPFRIAGYVFDGQDVVVVTLTDGEHVGRGEASGVYYLDETPDRMIAQINAQRDLIERGVSREGLRAGMPPGVTRSMRHCGIWRRSAAGSPCGSLPVSLPPDRSQRPSR